MTPDSSTFAWRISQTEEPGGLQFMGSLESDTTERLHFPTGTTRMGLQTSGASAHPKPESSVLCA